MRLAIFLVLAQAALVGVASAINPEAEALSMALWGASVLVLVAVGWAARSWASVFAGIPAAAVASLAVVLACCSGGEEDYIFDKVYDPGPGEWIVLTVIAAPVFVVLIAVGVLSRRLLERRRAARIG